MSARLTPEEEAEIRERGGSIEPSGREYIRISRLERAALLAELDVLRGELQRREDEAAKAQVLIGLLRLELSKSGHSAASGVYRPYVEYRKASAAARGAGAG